MADDNNLRPMNDADVGAPPTDTSFQPAVPLKDTGVEFEAEGGVTGTNTSTGVRQQLTDGVGNIQAQAGDKAREFAKLGQDKAAGALEQLATMLTDAADQVDAKLGAQYGGYARNAAETVQKFSGQVKDQDFDQLLDQGRELVRKSPGVAIGAAAAVGFVLARLVQSGLDADRA